MKAVLERPATASADNEGAGSAALSCWRAYLALALLVCLGTRSAMPQAAEKSSPTPAVTYSEAANRKALEDQAGKNPAKLMLRSVPDKSLVRINGTPVGKTPLLLIVRPGVYVIEMEGGPRIGYGRRQIDLLPKEAREVVLDLQPRYPATMNLPWGSRQ